MDVNEPLIDSQYKVNLTARARTDSHAHYQDKAL